MSQLEEKRAIFRRALAEVIRRERERKGMSLTQLGMRAGLSQQSVSYVEKERRYPNAETLLRIADAFGSELSELIAKAEQLAEHLVEDSSPKKARAACRASYKRHYTKTIFASSSKKK